MALNVSDRLLQLAMVVFVASLIGPADFGLMGIALLVVSALKRLTDLSVNASLVQHEDADVDRYLNTAWTLKAARGIALFAAVLAAAPAVAGLLGEPAATPVVRALGVSVLLLGLTNPGVMYLQKDSSSTASSCTS